MRRNKKMAGEKTIRVYYCAYPMEDMVMNFGDLLTIPILEHYKPAGINLVPSKEKECRMVAVGSVLHSYPLRRKIVWGTGALHGGLVRGFRADKHRIYALRGKKTMECIGLSGEDVQTKTKIALGDPGILANEVFSGTGEKNSKIGIIPHYFDAGKPELDKFRNDPRYMMIDVCRRPEEVIRDISACSAIASSSLHGLIIADSYGIPNRWLKISLEQDFKFHDYFSSIDRAGKAAEPVKAEEVGDGIFTPIQYTAGIEHSKRELRDSLHRLFNDVLTDNLPFKVHDSSMDLCQIPMTMLMKGCNFCNKNGLLQAFKRSIKRLLHR